MVAKRSRPAWRRHELVSKAIFEALLNQSNAENLEVKHNVKINGTKAPSHQIDVFWKFRMGGLDHTVIVEVKTKKERVKQGDMLRFQSVLLDIPGQPRGIFVSEQGYQKGALEVARAAGIPAYEIREVNREARSITMTHLSIAIVSHKRDQAALEWAIFEPTITDYQVSLDGSWLAEHPEAPRGQNIVAIISLARFLDAYGNERTSTRKLVQDRVQEFGQAGQTQLEVEFPDPTYVSGIIEGSNKDGNPIGDLKIVKLIVTLEVIKTTITVPMFSATASTYLFRNAVEGDNRYVLIAERGSDLAAVSLSPQKFRLTSDPPDVVSVSPGPGR
jgi:hypothetical protein